MIMNVKLLIIVLLSIFAIAANGFTNRGQRGGGRNGRPVSFPGGTGPFNPRPRSGSYH